MKRTRSVTRAARRNVRQHRDYFGRKRPLMRRYLTVRSPTPYNALYPFERNVSVHVRYNPSTGWEARGYGISFSFQQNVVLTEFGDQTVTSTAIAAATELTTLFDQWRLDKVDMQCFYTSTEVDGAAGSPTPMPTMYIVNDYDDSNVQAGVTNLAEYAQARTVQFNPVVNGIKHTLYKPGTRLNALVAGGTTRGVSVRSPWCDCSTPDIVHFAIKCQANGVPFFAPNNYIGSMMFQFKMYYSYKNQR